MIRDNDTIDLTKLQNAYHLSTAVINEDLKRLEQFSKAELLDELKKTLSQRNTIAIDAIHLGNGSTPLLELIANGLKNITAPDQKATVLLPNPSYSGFRDIFSGDTFTIINTKTEDKDHGHVHNIIKNISQSDVVVICNPNNPTGIQMSLSDIELILDEIIGKYKDTGKYTLAIFDQAFLRTIDPDEKASVLNLFDQYSNFMVVIDSIHKNIPVEDQNQPNGKLSILYMSPAVADLLYGGTFAAVKQRNEAQITDNTLRNAIVALSEQAKVFWNQLAETTKQQARMIREKLGLLYQYIEIWAGNSENTVPNSGLMLIRFIEGLFKDTLYSILEENGVKTIKTKIIRSSGEIQEWVRIAVQTPDINAAFIAIVNMIIQELTSSSD